MKLHTLFLLIAVNFALNVAHASTSDDRRIQSDIKPNLPILQTAPTPTPTGTALEVDEETLLASPELLVHALFSALTLDNADGVAVLLPIYERQDKARIDADSVLWAKAVLAMGQGDTSQAVAHYQTLSEKYPDNTLFAVRLGQAYFLGRQYQEAKAIFARQSPDVQAELAPYFEQIARQEKPKVSFNGNYLSDKNINNAPDNADLGGGWTANPPISAKGVAMGAAVSRRFLMGEGAFGEPQLSVQGKFYQDAKQYNELTVRASFGLGKQTAKTSVQFSPFIERQLYAGGEADRAELKDFLRSVGVSVAGERRFGQFGQGQGAVSVQGELAQNTYKTRPHLDGYSLSLSPSVTLYPKPNLVLSLSTDHQYVRTQDKDDSYRRTGVRLSAVKLWGELGMQASFSTAKRTYFAPMPIFNKTQENLERTASISLWHNRLRYANFTPRLTWQRQTTDSTIALYGFDKSKVFLEVSGGF